MIEFKNICKVCRVEVCFRFFDEITEENSVTEWEQKERKMAEFREKHKRCGKQNDSQNT